MTLKAKQAVTKNFNKPDERRDFKAHGHVDVLSLDNNLMVGRGIFEPGWKWSNDLKPIAGTESCQVEHLGYCLSGSMVIKMDSGEEIRIRPGEAFHLLPGHDAWVEGNERCELLDFAGFAEYAKPRKSSEAA